MSAATASSSAATVTVASKYPLPIRLQLQKKVSRTEETPGGIRSIDSYVKHGATFVIEGCAKPVGVDHDKNLVSGFALTHNVPAALWEEWVKQNEGFPPLENGLIFASPKAGYVADQARERKNELSGFEPVDPNKVPAEFAAVAKDA